jgi:hypothetical protein
MQPITDTEIADLKEKYAGVELNLISNEDVGVEAIVKTPPKAEWDRFRTMQQDDTQAPFALRTLLLGCAIKPTAEEWRSILETRPGLAETVGARLVKIGGVSSATTHRKL